MAAATDLDLSRSPWRKSTRSGNGNNCVEIATESREVLVRNTRDRAGTMLSFPPGAWQTFLAALK